jgi:CSLREA domain-containing protein
MAAVLAGVVTAAWLVPLPAAAAATFVVNRTGDAADRDRGDGVCDASATAGHQCTLRAAIQEANATAGKDTINFHIGTTTGVKTISPASHLPTITEPVVINGYSQPGASLNTLGTGDDAILEIQLNGTNAGSSANGLTIQADNCVVKGVVINRFGGDGIKITGSNNAVKGDLIGTSPAGDVARPNQFGVDIVGGSINIVGGTAPSARNVISGNSVVGLELVGPGVTGTLVRGNYIGARKAGDAALPNGFGGVTISDAGDTAVGGTATGAGNIISGNDRHGLKILNTTGTVVQGNLIGTDASGTADVGNLDGGIEVFSSPGIVIGGADEGSGNVISGNGQGGIFEQTTDGSVIQGNRIGAAATGSAALGNGSEGVFIFGGHDTSVVGNVIGHNGTQGLLLRGADTTITGNLVFSNGSAESGDFPGVEVAIGGVGNRILNNQIFGNAGLGIDLHGGTEDSRDVTANDTDDPDTGPNDLQNFPALASAVRATNGITIVSGSLNSTPSHDFTIQFFLADTESSNHGEALLFLGGKTVTTDAAGDESFSFFTSALSPGQEVTATATDASTGDTSEFSLNAIVVSAP